MRKYVRKYALVTIAITAACWRCFAIGSDFPVSSTPIQVISLASLTDEDIGEIMQGEHPEVAVEFTAGTQLPLSLYLRGDLATLLESEEKWGTIEIANTLYARCVEEELLLSSDLINWKPFLEFTSGTLFVSLHIQEGQPSLVIGSEANRRL